MNRQFIDVVDVVVVASAGLSRAVRVGERSCIVLVPFPSRTSPGGSPALQDPAPLFPEEDVVRAQRTLGFVLGFLAGGFAGLFVLVGLLHHVPKQAGGAGRPWRKNSMLGGNVGFFLVEHGVLCRTTERKGRIEARTRARGFRGVRKESGGGLGIALGVLGHGVLWQLVIARIAALAVGPSPSSFRLGTVLLQAQGEDVVPVVHRSKILQKRVRAAL
mmetsp:Transcript_27620/g.64815  ORF Transcript_27620/g.64815 Transcript_27620/m.64815 type:complete len:217 (-) Transcript_27620:1127-1777(-)